MERGDFGETESRLRPNRRGRPRRNATLPAAKRSEKKYGSGPPWSERRSGGMCAWVAPVTGGVILRRIYGDFSRFMC
ncbi:hypothetical protein JTE90_020569 [Oedothorax gibbosus]|uniref:Uncharacterized protein n=1 Tax=Oedothorax gibbosus TaxID=931172 RepID=A0AAV6VXW8_9ARAC|nr:hypothetical protein JTE90_020569 [Oedothorax gibbosus]